MAPASVAAAPTPAHDLRSAAPTQAAAIDDPKEAALQIIRRYVASLQSALDAGSAPHVASHFSQDGYWRDLMTLEWEFRTIQGSQKIQNWLEENNNERLSPNKVIRNITIEEPSVAIMNPFPGVTWLVSFFNFETATNRGRGCLRIQQDPTDGQWKAYTFFTGIEELKGYEMKHGANRKPGVDHGNNVGRKSWKTNRKEQVNYENGRQPQVVIIGGGQAGLTAAAQLGQLEIDALIIERNDRIGDNWRKRYDFLVLHDPVWYDHLPYMKFPDHWPVFTPKDKLGDWFEAYVTAMELNVWTSTKLESSEYDEASGKWTLKVTRGDGTQRTLTPKHLILATGHSGEANIPTFKGQEKFKGKICHSSQHTTGADFTNKKAIVVGCCNSGHDIAQDFVEQGADVTMVQRSSTYVMSSDSVINILFKDLYCEGGPPVEDADLIFHSIPNFLHKKMHKDVTAKIAEYDKETLDGLQKAGFKLDFGPDDSGFLMKYFSRGGGYYLDVGASKLIADGKIKMKQGQEISHFTEDGIVFADGQEIKADIVVLATGYKNMKTTAEKILGKEASKTNDVWGLDEEGELKTIWRNSGHPGLYYMGGNLALCRYMSKKLALYIKAKELGMTK
ncbi:flavin-binding monooxygenase-like protein [Violaceomyces palustris]|uniref:Flavin-binding monooxygenase-like protein n=1 Tax=Violaceomyces palustris TaxID=1673888 RepID=A0ACD0P5J0_9BASI|nr:flavin-binding monooxygenase-like protein [Violaceomyces palustris]